MAICARDWLLVLFIMISSPLLQSSDTCEYSLSRLRSSFVMYKHFLQKTTCGFASFLYSIVMIILFAIEIVVV